MPATRPLGCYTPACVVEGEGDAMIYIYVQYWRFLCVLKQLGHCEAEQKKLKLPLDPMFLSSSLSLN